MHYTFVMLHFALFRLQLAHTVGECILRCGGSEVLFPNDFGGGTCSDIQIFLADFRWRYIPQCIWLLNSFSMKFGGKFSNLHWLVLLCLLMNIQWQKLFQELHRCRNMQSVHHRVSLSANCQLWMVRPWFKQTDGSLHLFCTLDRH